ncbi:MAG: hypothetical protein AB7U83_00760 [Vicinamibacterales bacterium]
MDDIHRMMRDVPPAIYALMVGIPLTFAIAAVVLGWYAQAAARSRSGGSASPRAQQHALAAGITMAVVPLAFALLMLWGRFG